MRYLLLLLLIPFTLSAQRRVGEYYRIGKPTTTASVNDLSIDTQAQKVYEYYTSSTSVSVANRWREVTDTSITNTYFRRGQKGDQGIQGLQGERGMQGIQGQQGIQGIPGICPSCPPSSGGGISPYNVVIDNGTDNRAALQAAIDDSYITAKPIWIIGNNFKMSGGVVIPKDIKNLQIECSGIIVATNANPWTLFSSPVPINVAEAEGVYTNRRLVFNNIVFHGQGKAQTMFDLQAGEGIVYNNIEGKTLKLGIDNSFGLRSIINNPEFIHCTDGIKSKSASGKYPDATAENSAPNGTVIRDARSVADGSGNVGFLFADCSLCEIDGVVLEGTKHNAGIDWDCSSSTSTPATMRRIHFEGAQPCGIAVVRIKSSTMTHIIDNPNMIKPSMMVEVIPSGGGYPNVKFSNVSNQRVFFDDVNPILKSAVGVGWKFENCDSPFVISKMSKIFTGVSMSNSCVRENGLSRYCIESPPN